MHELDEQTVNRTVKLVDDLSKAKQKLSDLQDLLKNHDVCIMESQIQELDVFATRTISSETHLRSELIKILVTYGLDEKRPKH